MLLYLFCFFELFHGQRNGNFFSLNFSWICMKIATNLGFTWKNKSPKNLVSFNRILILLLSFVAFIRQSVTHMFATTGRIRKRNRRKKSIQEFISISTFSQHENNTKKERKPTFPSYLILLIFDIDFLLSQLFSIYSESVYKCCCFVNPAVGSTRSFFFIFSPILYFLLLQWKEFLFIFKVPTVILTFHKRAHIHKHHNIF